MHSSMTLEKGRRYHSKRLCKIPQACSRSEPGVLLHSIFLSASRHSVLVNRASQLSCSVWFNFYTICVSVEKHLLSRYAGDAGLLLTYAVSGKHICKDKFSYAALIPQLGEHCTAIAEVVGSNPAQSLNSFSGLCSRSVAAAPCINDRHHSIATNGQNYFTIFNICISIYNKFGFHRFVF